MRAFEFLKENRVIDEAPLPSDWDEKKFSPATSFKERLRYALKRAKELGTGSSRVAMIIKYQGRNTALKVAISEAGLAQNEVEKDILMSDYAKNSNLLIPIIDYDKKNERPTWIQTEVAKKITERKICNYIGCVSLNHMVRMAQFPTHRRSYVKTMKEMGKTKEEIKYTLQFVAVLEELEKKFDLELVDFKSVHNWGEYQGRPVIIDVGFNTEVLSTYYGF